MKIRHGMWLVAVVGSILLGSTGAWAQTQPMRSQSNPIAAGYEHTCMLRANGTVWCWGGNEAGQLGDGSTQPSLVPVEVRSLSDAVAIAAGNEYTCALMANGTVRCWGENAWGQLGDGSMTNRTTPADVMLPAGARAVAIAAGGNHACALMANGTVKCWGFNLFGQLGNGTFVVGSNKPVNVKNLTNVVAIAAGENHTCAVRVNGNVECWGANSQGQLGNGLPGIIFFQSDLPVKVVNLSNAVAIAAGDTHTCALKANGMVKCWGDNFHGQLGDNGIETFSPSPVTVVNLSDAVAIAGGEEHTCALLANGTARCWGWNLYGQLGDGTTQQRRNKPTAVSALSDAVAIAAGEYHTCALLADGAVKCWGDNYYGQLGDGTMADSLTPVTVAGETALRGQGAIDVAAGKEFSCAVLADGTARCWGHGFNGQLGNGTSGTSANSSTPVEVQGLSNAVTISTGGSHSCAVLANGTAKCWGQNNHGQLGDIGPETSSALPVTVENLDGSAMSDIKAIAAGEWHTCALLADGTVKCWGWNAYGQLGDGTTDTSYFAVKVQGLGGAVVAISTGRYYSCAVLVDGTARCWGYNSDGQVGDGNSGPGLFSATPVPVKNASGTGVIAGLVTIAAGDYHTCAALVDGTARCWGKNSHGQLGDGISGNGTSSALPVAVSGLSGAVAIAAGRYHSCAALADGTAECWGWNYYGQLGDGSGGNGSDTSQPLPVPVSLLGNVAGIAAGGDHTCALLSSGMARCWGYNIYGQLGDGTTINRYRPVPVDLYPCKRGEDYRNQRSGYSCSSGNSSYHPAYGAP